jgi:sulfatase maturation enzyme AslB (radical SAM superfamily)
MAKWLQVSINLNNGTTQSCYHPPAHPIPLEELAIDVSALHNTNFKKQERKEMLEGKRPKGCSYCWRVEDAPGNNLSDRHYKSSENWALPFHEEVINKPFDFDIIPRYVEVNFNRACNFKCMYCSPHISTTWEEEIEKFGPYKFDHMSGHNDIVSLKEKGFMPIEISNRDNPYVAAFWEWWPKIYRSLRVFRMTGGEPLMDKNTFRVLDYVNKNPHGQLELSITSNLCPPNQKLFERFVEQVKQIEITRTYEDPENFNEFSQNYWYVDKGFKHFWLYVSFDSVSEQAEYMRTGLDFDRMLANIKTFLRETKYTTVSFINTFNLLSIPNLKGYLELILDLRKEFGGQNQIEFEIAPEATEEEKANGIEHKKYQQKKFQRIFFDIPLLNYPNWFDARNATPELIQQVEDCINFMIENEQDENYINTFEGFKPHEIMKLKRNLSVMKESFSEEILTSNKRKFYQFISEYDRRRETDFLSVFPKMIKYYNECKNI